MSGELPIIESCDNCGACCFEQQSPPGYVMLLSQPDFADDPGPFEDDVERLLQLPEEAITELRSYLKQLLSGNEPEDQACIWLNHETNQCRFHDLRPSVCRDLKLNSEDCHGRREAYGIINPRPEIIE